METDLLLHGNGGFAEVYTKQNIQWKSPQVSSIQYLHDLGVLQTKPLLAHCVKVGERDIELISMSDSRIAHCPKSNAKFGHGIAPLEKFFSSSIKVGIGSDSVASNNTCDILEEARFAALFARTKEKKTSLLSAKDILKAVTYGGAETLGLEKEIGSLEAGKQADLIVVKVENVAQQPVFDIYATILFATSVREIYLTMCAGEEVFRDGKALKIDETELKNKLKELSKKL
jgi:5-methylthioadenosine/S-adenosylhomocysteine deaminase